MSKISTKNNGNGNHSEETVDSQVIAYSTQGKKMLDELIRCYPQPVLLLGETGWGKSILSRSATKALGIPYASINAHKGMDMNILVGLHRPKNNKGHIEVVWEDGLLTQSIRNGGGFLFEELTRAPREIVSRLHGVMDTTDRYWSLPEAGQGNVNVHQTFWFIATANPAGEGYQAEQIEKALMSRFAAQFDINSPIADEEAVLSSIVAKDVAGRMMRVATDSRRSKASILCTRDLVLWAKMVARGFKPERAFDLSVLPKHTHNNKGMREIVSSHFATYKE